MGDILFLAEQEGGKLKGYSAELAGKSSALAKELGGHAIGAVLGENVYAAAESLGTFGAAKAFAIEDASLEPFRGDAFFKALLELVQKTKPQIIMPINSN